MSLGISAQILQIMENKIMKYFTVCVNKIHDLWFSHFELNTEMNLFFQNIPFFFVLCIDNVPLSGLGNLFISALIFQSCQLKEAWNENNQI